MPMARRLRNPIVRSRQAERQSAWQIDAITGATISSDSDWRYSRPAAPDGGCRLLQRGMAVRLPWMRQRSEDSRWPLTATRPPMNSSRVCGATTRCSCRCWACVRRLAVSNSAINALTMGLATSFVLLMSGRWCRRSARSYPREARIVSYICIIASFVTCVDYLIKAISLDLHRSLGAFISLIVVNCLILGRAEAFASKNPHRAARCWMPSAWASALRLRCLSIGMVREILGSGSLFGLALFPERFPDLDGDDSAQRRLLCPGAVAAGDQSAARRQRESARHAEEVTP